MKAVPECAGLYEAGDSTCNGSVSESECGWKQQCKALQSCCLAQFMDIDDFLAGKSLAQVEKAVEPFMPIPRSMYKKGRVSSLFSDECWHLYEHFEHMMIENFGARVSNLVFEVKPKRVIAREGIFFPIERLETIKNITWYCRVANGLNITIAIVHFRKSFNTLHIDLACTVDEILGVLNVKHHKKLELQEKVEGALQSRCENCGYEQIGLLLDALRKLIDIGEFDLPPLKRRR